MSIEDLQEFDIAGLRKGTDIILQLIERQNARIFRLELESHFEDVIRSRPEAFKISLDREKVFFGGNVAFDSSAEGEEKTPLALYAGDNTGRFILKAVYTDLTGIQYASTRIFLNENDLPSGPLRDHMESALRQEVKKHFVEIQINNAKSEAKKS